MTAPRNQGDMEAPDGVGQVVGPVCGDAIAMRIKVSEGRIVEARFTTYGCWAAVAVCSLITETVRGGRLEAALKLDGTELARREGLPEDKTACAELAVEALHRAVRDCRPEK